jgi:hypothetical protein
MRISEISDKAQVITMNNKLETRVILAINIEEQSFLLCAFVKNIDMHKTKRKNDGDSNKEAQSLLYITDFILFLRHNANISKIYDSVMNR